MTKLTMPEPAAYVRFADNGNIRMWSPSAYEGEEFMKPLYTAEALRDVLEQAAKACGGLRVHDIGHPGTAFAVQNIAINAIRAMKEQVK